MTETLVTANQVAKVLGVRRQSVQSALKPIAPAQTAVGGQQTRKWKLPDLPPAIRDRLTDAAQDSGCRSVEHLLTEPVREWRPAVPFAECTEYYQRRALKLRDALESSLRRRNDESLSRTDWESIGLAEYKRVFGHSISSRRWNDLVQRTLERAGTLGNFNRVELYLDERSARRGEIQPAVTVNGFVELERVFSLCADESCPGAAEQAKILETAVNACYVLMQAGESQKAARTHILELLWTRTRLAPSRNALRVKFDRAYRRWEEADFKTQALSDGRKQEAKSRRRIIPEEDRQTIEAITVMECGGRLSQAWRICMERGALSENFVNRFAHNPACKSRVPNIVRRIIGPGLAALMEQHHGSQAARDNGAWLERYWGCVPSRAWYQMDDVTLPVYYFVSDGKGWFTLMRGQFLLAIDVRSTCVLGYALMPERNYNARVIRSLLTHVCDGYGLPLRGFYFERGIWENSKILKGETSQDVPEECRDIEKGLTEFGLVFKHAIRARSKPIERVIGALQNLMEAEPGYAGRNEITAGFEEFKKLKLKVDSRSLDPRGKFYDLAQWDERLHQLCCRYNAERQQGKMTEGLSPEEAFARFQDPHDKAVHLDARCRYLLAHHKRPIRVTANGITLRFGKQVFNYRNEQTGMLRGQMVIAWFNPEAPDILAVTDMKRENPFCVERSQAVPALDAQEEILAQENGRVEDHMRYASTRYRILKSKYNQEFRPNLVSGETVELGRKIENGRADIQAAVSRKQQTQSRAREAFGRLNFPVPDNATSEEIEAAKRLERLLKESKT